MASKFTKIRFEVTNFPKDTKEIFISGSCGTLGKWDPRKAIKLQYYENENEPEQFFVEVSVPKNEIIEYKYLNHQDWTTVECGLIAQDIPNRSITTKNENYRIETDEIKGFIL